MNEHTNPSVSTTIDRLIQATTTTHKNESFIPSQTFQGRREGYYFANGNHGTGYYLDTHTSSSSSSSTASSSSSTKGGKSTTKRSSSTVDHTVDITSGTRKRNRVSLNDNDDGATASKSSSTQRSVRFGSDSIRTIPSRHTHTADVAADATAMDIDCGGKTPEQLLEEAERSLASSQHRRKTLSLSHNHNTNDYHKSQQQQQQQQLKSHIQTLRNNTTKNQIQRAKYPTQPEKFMESELSLHENIESIRDMAASVSHYTEFVQLGAVDDLVGLLSHENIDVAAAVVALLVELLDPGLVGSTEPVTDDDDAEDVIQRREKALKMDGMAIGGLALAFLGPNAVHAAMEHVSSIHRTNAPSIVPNDGPTKHTTMERAVGGRNGGGGSGTGGLELCVSNLRRFDNGSQEEEELKAIDDLLTLVENLLDLDRMGVFQLIHNTQPSNNNHDNENDKGRNHKNDLVENATHNHRTNPSYYPYASIASIIVTTTTLTTYLLDKLSRKKKDDWSMTLRLHASEVLTSILQHEDSRRCLDAIAELPPYTSVFDEEDPQQPQPQPQQPQQRHNKRNANNEKKELDGMEALLQSIAPYRKKDPVTEEECEYLQNMFDALAACLLPPSSDENDQNTITTTTANNNHHHETNNNHHHHITNKNIDAFLERQGIELMIRCITERVHSGYGASRVLYFALSSPYPKPSEVFVEAGGLKTVFPLFLGRRQSLPRPARCCDAGNVELLAKYHSSHDSNNNNHQQDNQNQNHKTNVPPPKKPSKLTRRVVSANKEWYRGIETHSVQILYSLTRHLTQSSPHDARNRLLVKFLESDCEKCDRLIELLTKYDAKTRRAEYRYYASDEAEEAEERGLMLGDGGDDVDFAALEARLRGGGEMFHRVGAVVGFVCRGSKRCHEYVLEQLRMQNSGIGVVKAALEEFAGLLDNDSDQKRQLSEYLDAI